MPPSKRSLEDSVVLVMACQIQMCTGDNELKNLVLLFWEKDMLMIQSIGSYSKLVG